MPFIYALKNKTSEDVYYGSTTQTLQQRFAVHKSQHKAGVAYLQKTAGQVLDCPTAYIELCEEVSKENKGVRERWWVENNPCVNIRVPTRPRKETYEREYSRQKEYYAENREKINAYKQEWARKKKLVDNLASV